MTLTTHLRCLAALAILAVAGNAGQGAPRGASFRLTDEVAQLIKSEKYAEAEAAITKTGKQEPELIAWLKIKQGKKSEGMEILKRQVSETKTDRLDAVIRSLQVLSDASPKDGIDLSKFYVEGSEFKDQPSLKLFLAQLYLRQKEPKLAVPLIDEVLNTKYSGEDLTTALYRVVLYFYEYGSSKEALTYFDKLTTRVPETKLDPGYQMQWAHIASAAGRPLDALKKLDWLQNTFPKYYQENTGLFFLSKGNAYDAMGDKDQARKEFEALMKLAKENPKFQSMSLLAERKVKEYQDTVDANKTAAAAHEVETRPPRGWNVVLVSVNVAVVVGLTAYVVVRRRNRHRESQPVTRA